MPLMDWKSEYSVNISGFDNQHKKIVGLINSLHTAMSEGKGKEILGKVLDDLLAYTVFHFAAEEKIMKEHSFPGFVQHKLEHERLTKQVEEFRNDYHADKTVVSQEILLFLKKWLVNHISGTDKQYSSFLNTKGVVCKKYF